MFYSAHTNDSPVELFLSQYYFHTISQEWRQKGKILVKEIPGFAGSCRPTLDRNLKEHKRSPHAQRWDYMDVSDIMQS
jgi:hypothetical protein